MGFYLQNVNIKYLIMTCYEAILFEFFSALLAFKAFIGNRNQLPSVGIELEIFAIPVRNFSYTAVVMFYSF